MLDEERIWNFLQAIAGDTPSSEWSKRLGYRSDTVRRWMDGQRGPKSRDVFRWLILTGRDPVGSLAQVLDPSANVTLKTLARQACRAAVGGRSQHDIAGRTGLSRFVIQRILAGDGAISFTHFVAVLEAVHRPILDILLHQPGSPAALVDDSAKIASNHAIIGIANGQSLVLGTTMGTLTASVPQIMDALNAALDNAVSALPIRAAGRRRATVGVHMARIDGRALHAPSLPATQAHLCRPDDMDFNQVSRELVRGLRAHRSQRAVSMRLGFRSNVVYRWETGRSIPAAVDVLRFVELTGTSVVEVFRTWQPSLVDLPDDIGACLVSVVDQLAHAVQTNRLISDTDLDRHSVGRVRRGKQRIRLPDLLALAHAATGQVLDLLEALLTLDTLPSVSVLVDRRTARRSLAEEYPDSGRLMLALQHAAWVGTAASDLDQLGQMMQRDRPEVDAMLATHELAGLITNTPSGWRVCEHVAVQHGKNRRSYERMTTWLLQTCAKGYGAQTATGRAVTVSFDQTNVTDALRALSGGVLQTRRATVPSGQAPDVTAVVAVHITALDGEPLTVKRL